MCAEFSGERLNTFWTILWILVCWGPVWSCLMTSVYQPVASAAPLYSRLYQEWWECIWAMTKEAIRSLQQTLLSGTIRWKREVGLVGCLDLLDSITTNRLSPYKRKHSALYSCRCSVRMSSSLKPLFGCPMAEAMKRARALDGNFEASRVHLRQLEKSKRTAKCVKTGTRAMSLKSTMDAML